MKSKIKFIGNKVVAIRFIPVGSSGYDQELTVKDINKEMTKAQIESRKVKNENSSST